MNNKHILDLTLRLSQALDQNYDVVSMDTVLSVISSLECTTITKEQLEATRLAKYVNQLRRRTNSEDLARRAKSLLKRWREMVGIQQQHQRANDSLALTAPSDCPVTCTVTSGIATAITAYNVPVTDNAVTVSHLQNPHFSNQHFQRRQFQSTIKYQLQPYHSQPTSPVNFQETSNAGELSISSPVRARLKSKSSNLSVRKKKKLDNTSKHDQSKIEQPTSFANLLTGLGCSTSSSFTSTRGTSFRLDEIPSQDVKPVETFVIDHSSNSNSDVICLAYNSTVSGNITTATDVPPIVIDLQDTNSSITSVVSKDITNASFSAGKVTSKKSKKMKKRKERDMISRQTQPLQNCDNNTTTGSYLRHIRPPDMLLLDEKSHSACPTISNISGSLSLSNSSLCSVLPSTEGISKNTSELGQSELVLSSSKMTKSDLTFAGKFKQNTSNLFSSASAGCDILIYNTDSMNLNVFSSSSPNQNKFSLFCGSGTTNSNDSASCSRTSQFNVAVDAVKHEVSSNSKEDEGDGFRRNTNRKPMSNLSNKGNLSTDSVVSAVVSSGITAPHQPSIDLSTIELSAEQTIKQPKKRGRKRGSKGVDSIIAKETSLSSQILISSLSAAGKKVKTTKELYAEMENRKSRNVKSMVVGEETPSSLATTWTIQEIKTMNSPRTSSCSESDSCTMTSEPSHDSNCVYLKTVGKRKMPVDSNSDCSQNGSGLKMTDTYGEGITSATTAQNTTTLTIALKIKNELQELLKHLPPTPTIKEIECDCLKYVTPCTCTIKEIVAPIMHNTLDWNRENINVDLNLHASDYTFKHSKNEIVADQATNITDNKSLSKLSLDQLSPPTKLKRSIFDLDFDDDEDPLKSIIADIVGKNTTEYNMELVGKSATTSPANVKNFITPPRDEYFFSINNLEQDPEPFVIDSKHSSTDVLVIPSYNIKYDPECKAKKRLEEQRQKITKFHVDTLHNCFIPNVNGNWNHVDVTTYSQAISILKSENNDNINIRREIVDGYKVVPFYGSEMNEPIAKDLSYVKFTKAYKHKSWNCQNEILFHIPFMGVSRLPPVTKLKAKKIDFLKLDNEEEKENIENKLNFYNKYSTCAHDSVFTIKKCSEKENIDVQEIKKVPITKKKERSKKPTTFMKCSTAKRLKLSVNVSRQETQTQCNVESTSRVTTLPLPCNESKSGISPENLEFLASDSDYDMDGNSDNDDNIIPYIENQRDGDEFDGRELNIYHHGISDNSNDQSHIVLTIKKTPSKANSPLNTLSNLFSLYSGMYENVNSVKDKENPMSTSLGKQTQELDLNNFTKEDKTRGRFHKSYKNRLRTKRIKRKRPNRSFEDVKMHKCLFYHEEINPLIKHGTQTYRENIFQISSCSSSCSADEEPIAKPPCKLRRRARSTSSSSSVSTIESDIFRNYGGHTLNLQQDIIFSEFKKRTIYTSATVNSGPENNESSTSDLQQLEEDSENFPDNDDYLEENNLMLVSFNHIYSTRDRHFKYLNNEQLKKKYCNERVNNLLKQHQNCDDNNLNDNFNSIKYTDHKSSVSNNDNSSIINYLDSHIADNSSETELRILRNQGNSDGNNVKIGLFQEYQTGIRAVDKDVNDDYWGNNGPYLQQFKEWHEVLQLRSYNDELLTVLPYVVLD